MSLGVTMSISASWKTLTDGGLASLFFYLERALSIADEERKVEEVLHGLRKIVRVYDELEDIDRLTVQIVQDAFELYVSYGQRVRLVSEHRTTKKRGKRTRVQLYARLSIGK